VTAKQRRFLGLPGDPDGVVVGEVLEDRLFSSVLSPTLFARAERSYLNRCGGRLESGFSN